MPQFEYKAKDATGLPVEGVIEANNESSAADLLSRENLFISSVKEFQSPSHSHLSWVKIRSVSRNDLATVTRQLADLLKGGLSLVLALELLGRDLQNLRLKAAIAEIRLDVEQGKSFSVALARMQRVFPPLFAGMVASGEAVGRLPEVLISLADRLEAEEELRSKIRSAFSYPLVLLFVGAITSVLLVTFVIPRLAVVFEDIGQDLPMPTRILMGTSSVLTQYWWIIVLTLMAMAFCIRHISHRPGFHSRLDHAMMRLPVLGPILISSEVSRFTRTMAILLRSGLSLLVALEISERTAGNSVFKDMIKNLMNEISEGRTLSSAMQRSQVFSAASAHVVAIGEGSNDQPGALDQVAAAEQRVLEEKTRLLGTLIEPVLVILVGLVVGFIVFAMMLPILSIDISTIGG